MQGIRGGPWKFLKNWLKVLSKPRPSRVAYKKCVYRAKQFLPFIFLSLRFVFAYCCHLWCSCQLSKSFLDKVQKRIVNIVGPALWTSLDPLCHCRNVPSLSLFYKYMHGYCSLHETKDCRRYCYSSVKEMRGRGHFKEKYLTDWETTTQLLTRDLDKFSKKLKEKAADRINGKK